MLIGSGGHLRPNSLLITYLKSIRTSLQGRLILSLRRDKRKKKKRQKTFSQRMSTFTFDLTGESSVPYGYDNILTTTIGQPKHLNCDFDKSKEEVQPKRLELEVDPL
ncbi:hypothetical protein CR513_62952, partial [Mucuna pruriens]